MMQPKFLILASFIIIGSITSINTNEISNTNSFAARQNMTQAERLLKKRTRLQEITTNPTIPATDTDAPVEPIGEEPQTEPEPDASPIQESSDTEVMAWLYPYTPACGADEEFSDGRQLNILKAEYFTVTDGELVILDSSNTTCNGFSTQNVNTLRSNSQEQFVTISSADPASMNTFLKKALADGYDTDTLVNFVVTNNLTGIELDFEGFGKWTDTHYTLYKEFVEQLGTALHAVDKKLMIDGPAIANTQAQSWFVWRYEDFISLPVDKIVVMAYDYQYDYGAGEPIAPLDWITDVVNWVTNEYPAEKLSIGVPSYGYSGLTGSYDLKILTYNQMSSLNGFSTATRDQNSAEMTWNSGNTVYYYQDKVSIQTKIDTIIKAGVNSVSIWHLGGNQWFE